MKASSGYDIFRLLLIASFLQLTGCATLAWHEHANNSVEPHFRSGSATGYTRYAAHSQGFYLGKINSDGTAYYKYSFPNGFSKPNDKAIEIKIPVDVGTDVPAELDYTKEISISAEPAFARFSIRSAAIPRMNPKHLEIVLQDAGESRASTYPSLLSIHLASYGDTPQLDAGRRLTVSEVSALNHRGALAYRHDAYTPICLETTSDHREFNKRIAKAGVDPKKCDWWMWNRWTDVEGAMGEGQRAKARVIEYLGYVGTVPVDVATIPLQAIYFGAIYLWLDHAASPGYLH